MPEIGHDFTINNTCQIRDLPWACGAGLLGLPKLFYTKVLGGSCDPGVDVFGLMQIFIKFLGAQKSLE